MVEQAALVGPLAPVVRSGTATPTSSSVQDEVFFGVIGAALRDRRLRPHRGGAAHHDRAPLVDARRAGHHRARRSGPRRCSSSGTGSTHAAPPRSTSGRRRSRRSRSTGDPDSITVTATLSTSYGRLMRTRYHWARRSEQLDPVRDSHEISLHVSAYDFPWDNLQALSFALFRTYAVPVDRPAARRDRRVHRPRAEAVRRHRAPPRGGAAARVRQHPRPVRRTPDQPDARHVRHQQRGLPLRARHLRGGAEALDGRLRLPHA